MMLPPVPNYQDQMQADMWNWQTQNMGGMMAPQSVGGPQVQPIASPYQHMNLQPLPAPPNSVMPEPGAVGADPNQFQSDIQGIQASYDQMANMGTQALPPVPGSPEAMGATTQAAGATATGATTQGTALPQKCVTPEGLNGTWDTASGQCIPDTAAPPPDTTQPDPTQPDPTDTTTPGSCFDAKGNKVACPKPGDREPDGSGCKEGTRWNPVDMRCDPIPVKDDGCEDGYTRDPKTGKCVRGPKLPAYECEEGFKFHPYAGCVPDDGTSDDIPDWETGVCTTPDGAPGIFSGGVCTRIGDDPTDAPDKMPTPDPGDPFDVGTSPGGEGIGDEVNGVDPVKVAESDSFNYDEVQKHIDDAMANAERYLKPQEQMEDERFKQELINQGIDPYSAAGQKALKQKQIGQNDRRSKAMFDAMSFGKEMQAQMWDQEAFETTNAKDLNELIANLGQRAHEFDITAGMTADEMNWGKIADVMGWNRQDFYDWRDENRWIDSLIFAMAGLTPPAQFHGGTVNPSQIANAATG